MGGKPDNTFAITDELVSWKKFCEKCLWSDPIYVKGLRNVLPPKLADYLKQFKISDNPNFCHFIVCET
jgi:hypothetical protein